MDWARAFPVFHVLVWLHSAWAHVEPPRNVTFHCRNLHNVLKWNYNQFVPGLRFKVSIGSKIRSIEERWVDPPSQQIDVSFLSNPRDDYFLDVSAVVGRDASAAMPPEGVTFSYFKDSPVEQICLVDLPSVNVTARPDANVVLRFTHPWLLYHDKLDSGSNSKHMKRSEDYEPQIEELLPEFNYVVTMYQHRHDFSCEERLCEEILPVDSTQQNHCLTIVGELERMRVRGTQPFCPSLPIPPKHNNNLYILVSLLSLGVSAGFVFIMVCWKRTRPSSQLTIWPIRSNHPHTFTAQPVDITVPEVEPASPTPLLYGEDDEISTAVTPQTDSLRLPLGITEDEDVFVVIEGEQESNEEAGYTRGTDLDEVETENFNDVSSGYESRPVLDNLGPDDRAEG